LHTGDFGLATFHKNEKIKGIAGTYYYSPPELLRDKLYSSLSSSHFINIMYRYDRAGDIFSLGCIFYEMATLQLLSMKRLCFGEDILRGFFSPSKILAEFADVSVPYILLERGEREEEKRGEESIQERREEQRSRKEHRGAERGRKGQKGAERSRKGQKGAERSREEQRRRGGEEEPTHLIFRTAKTLVN
jgi:Protein kinase domain